MFKVPRNFQIVVITSPYDSLQDPFVRELFPKVLSLKITGYGKEYPYGVMPIDTYDFIASHIVVLDSQSQDPIMAYKSVTHAKCRAHHLPFPALSLLKSSPSDTQAHQRVLERVLGWIDQQSRTISYDSSWTIHPEIRTNREVTGELRDIMMAMMIHFHQDRSITDQIGAGVLRFKTQNYFQSFGYSLFEENGEVLPDLQLASLWNERVVLMHCQGYREPARELAAKHQALWNQRVELGTPAEIVVPQRRRAA